MKKILFACFTIISAFIATAQQKQGRVIFERVSQVQISVAGLPAGMESPFPKTRTDKFELSFANNQTLWKQAEQENEDNSVSGGDGVQMHIMIAGSNDVLYTNLNNSTKVEKRDLFDKSFIIDDSVRALKWKMTGETKIILNMPCMKATASNIRTRTQTVADNGKFERKEVTDTVLIVAWFTSSIPVSAGPGEYQGQLPGLILEMDINNGTQVFKALSIDTKADIASIKEPTGKKRYTPAEYRKERDKMMKEMEENNGGRRMMRMN